MDEPLSNLDALLRVQMRSELLQAAQAGRPDDDLRHPRPDRGDDDGRPHRASCATASCSRWARPSEVYSRPANTFVAIFVGSPPMNLIPGRLTDARRRITASRDRSRSTSTAWSRPDLAERARSPSASDRRTSPSPDRPTTAPSPATVELVEAVGADSYLSVAVGDGLSVMARVPADTRVAEGERVHLRFPSDSCASSTRWNRRTATDAVGETATPRTSESRMIAIH